MKKTLALIPLLLSVFSTSALTGAAFCMDMTDDALCRVCNLDCKTRFTPRSSFDLTEDQIPKKLTIIEDSEEAGAQNTSVIVTLSDGKTCKVVLEGGGSEVSFKVAKGKLYPDIVAYWHMSVDEGIQTRYVWNGETYENPERKARIEQSKQLNTRALQLFKQGKIEAAVKVWEDIIENYEGNSEVLNNLGFAWYKLAKRKNDHSLYTKASRYLDQALEYEPDRWSALLNSGDLQYDINNYVWALKKYRRLLEVKPDYKHADKIRKRIDELRHKPEKIGVEVISKSYPSGRKNITYIRIDEANVLRQGFFENGALRFQENIVNGVENGVYKSWFSNGQLAVEGQQENGEEVGKFIYYNEDGSVSQVLIHNVDGTSKDVTAEYLH